MERQLGYDPIGPDDKANLLEHPIDAPRAYFMGNEATRAAQAIYGETNPELQDGEPDAFPHALWSYMMAKELGSDTAKAFGDGHERSGIDSPGGRLMDLYNNAVGRDLAKDPANLGRPDRDVIRDAIRDGKLQTRPFQVGGPHGDGPQYRRRY